MKKCEKCVHNVACKKTAVACKYMKDLSAKSMFLEFQNEDTVTGKEYEISIDTVFIAFPGLKTMGQRLEVFYKKKGAKYGKFYELGTVIISDGKFKIINW